MNLYAISGVLLGFAETDAGGGEESTGRMAVKQMQYWWEQFVSNETALRILAVGLSVVLGLFLYGLLTRGVTLYCKRNNLTYEFDILLTKFLRWIYFPILVLVILQLGGVDLGSFWTMVSAGLAMVAIGFVAVWSVISNVSASIMIFAMRHFRIGDEIELIENGEVAGMRGQVRDITLMFTVLQEPADKDGNPGPVLKIPNNMFFQRTLRTHSYASSRKLDRPKNLG